MNQDGLKQLTAKWLGPGAGILLVLAGAAMLAAVIFMPSIAADRQKDLWKWGGESILVGLAALGIAAQNTTQLQRQEQVEKKVEATLVSTAALHQAVADTTAVAVEGAKAAQEAAAAAGGAQPPTFDLRPQEERRG